ncbi:SNF1-related protein kinase regulatory subunit gamma-1-like [Hibiscus syriacus]|uniref:SNF1-related protein kinase regulatory subunit gamma-1-like n=1 Tax=Hibiscus syriacus TaxID=106335 RepID=UPI001920DEA4|nr:SNF1-related protein kinase regulatory subunit gamma-1-like [Hibiscus syriacus]
MADLQMRRENSVGLQVEDLWAESKLDPTEKLNDCFESIPVSDFPATPQEIEIRSDASLAEAVRLLARNKILSAPVVNVDAPEDASWIDRYIGMVEFAGIAVWILQQSEPSSPCNADASISGDFFEALTSSEFYKNIQVRDISGSFRWGPFLALEQSNSFLAMLLLLSKYKMKCVPIVDFGDGKIKNIITQSAVIHMLAECTGLHWFESWGAKKLPEIGLPVITSAGLIKVHEDEPVLQAFKLMSKKKIGGLPVVDGEGKKAIGNISLRDIQFLLTAPEIYLDYRSITTKNFLIAVKKHLEEHDTRSPMLSGMITCTRDQTVKELIQTLDMVKIQRLYVVDDSGNLEGVVTLRDIISKLVYEPPGYFGDFFDAMLPPRMTAAFED